MKRTADPVKHVLFLTAILFIAGILLPLSAYADPAVEIYGNFDSRQYGLASDRRTIHRYSLDIFRSSETLPIPDEGFLTVLTFSAGLLQDLRTLTEDDGVVRSDDMVISRNRRGGRDVYTVAWAEVDLEFSFSLEEAPEDLFDIIDRVYPVRSDAASEVKTHYRDNYLIRIHGAENFLNPQGERVEFEEALVTATLIGEPFQHLLGVRDGLDLLGNLGYVVMKERYGEPRGERYRPLREGWEDLNRFMMKLESMPGDPVDNLYKLTSAAFHAEDPDGRISPPEKFVSTMRGDTLDLAFFYYDILRRLGMDAKLLCIRSGGEKGDLRGGVVFRSGRQEWKFMDWNGVQYETAAVWDRLPAIAYDETVSCIELDIEDILENDRYPAPGAGDWTLSVY